MVGGWVSTAGAGGPQGPRSKSWTSRSFGRSTPGGVKTMFGSLPLLNAKKNPWKNAIILGWHEQTYPENEEQNVVAIPLPVEESWIYPYDFGIHHAQKVTGRHRSVMETASSVLVSCLWWWKWRGLELKITTRGRNFPFKTWKHRVVNLEELSSYILSFQIASSILRSEKEW